MTNKNPKAVANVARAIQKPSHIIVAGLAVMGGAVPAITELASIANADEASNQQACPENQIDYKDLDATKKDAESKGVLVKQGATKTVHTTPEKLAETKKKIEDEKKADIAKLNSTTKKYVTDKSARDAKAKNPKITGGGDFSESQLRSLIKGQEEHVVLIGGGKATNGQKMTFTTNAKPISQSKYDSIKSKLKVQNPGVMDERDNEKGQISEAKVGQYFEWKNAITSPTTGHNLNVRLTITSINDKSGNELTNLVSWRKTVIGVCPFQPMDNVGFKMEVTDSTTGKAPKESDTYILSLSDVDALQGATFKTPYKNEIHGSNVTKSSDGKTFKDETGDAVESTNTKHQAWLLFDKSTIEYNYFTKQAPDVVDHYMENYHAWGTVPFGVEIPPVVPAPTVNIAKTNIIVDGKATPVNKIRVNDKGVLEKSTTFNLGEKLYYKVSSIVDQFHKDGKPVQKFGLYDPLIPEFNYEKADVKQGSTDITKQGQLTHDSKTNLVGFTLTGNALKSLFNKTIDLMPTVTVKKGADLSKYIENGQLKLPNSSYKTLDGEKVDGPTVKVTPKGKLTGIEKVATNNLNGWKLDRSIVGNNAKSDVTGQKDSSNTQSDNKGETVKSKSSKSILEVQPNKEFGYVLKTKSDMLDEKGTLTTDLTINDPLAPILDWTGIQIIDKSDGNKDVTNLFKISPRLKTTLTGENLQKRYDHNFEVRIGARVNPKNANANKYKQADGSYKVPNVATKLINGKEIAKDSADVKTPVPKHDKKTPKHTPATKTVTPKVSPAETKAPHTGVMNKMTNLFNQAKSVFVN